MAAMTNEGASGSAYPSSGGRDSSTHYRSLEVDEAWTLDQAMARSAFTTICEGLCEWIDPVHAPGRIAAFLARWLGKGMVTSAER